jgi:galactonate dehydratase
MSTDSYPNNERVPIRARPLGGPVRDRLRLYWSHCGTYRLHHAEKMGLPPIRTLDDIRKLCEHVRERRFTALKTNIFLFDGGSPELYMPGFGRSPGGPELNPSLPVGEELNKQLAAFRDGTARTLSFSSISISTSRPRATSASSVRRSDTG